jgi:hypothetical protein
MGTDGIGIGMGIGLGTDFTVHYFSRQVFMDHHRLEVYRLAREIHRDIRRLLAQVPRGNAELVNQLKKSAASITQNIAEGAAEFSPREKARIYRLASGKLARRAAR